MSYPHQPDQPQQQPYPQQPAGQPGQPAAYGPPPVPPKRKGLGGWAITGIVVGAIAGVCLIAGVVAALVVPEDDPDPGAATQPEPAETSAPASDQPAEEPEEETQAGIGDPVRDGTFEFTVTDVETGVESVGDDFLGKEAQGQFVMVHVTVANIGDEAQLFDGSSQFMFDTEGREHSADGEAAIYLPESESFLNEINPGNEVDAIVVFDIPADATPATVRLHDSPFSGGVEVAVG